ncbi:MAG: prohibitin family protein [Candidatus Electrothrix sp. AW5]|nr:prohibitin family protein [Candidatus Electrothrix gigas]MCI5196845.1 prohibitin family protein [Candidatus Electrothrix gigas]
MSEVRQKIKRALTRYLSAFLSFFLIILIVTILLFNRIVVFIGPGEGGVLYRLFLGGTVTTRVYPEGIQFIWPWDTMYIYNARIQEYPHEFDALTVNGLKVHLNLSVRYRPEYKLLGVLHQQVGEDYVNIVVLPEIENVLRVLLGSLNAEEIYTTKQSLLEKAINGAIEQIARRYIQVDDVIIKKIQLPDSVAESIRNKIRQKHIADAYVFRLQREEQEKERRRIEAEGLERFREALSPSVLQYMGIQATLELSKSENAKIVVVGGGKDGGLPIIGNMPLSFTDDPSTSSEIDESSSVPPQPEPELLPDNRIKEPAEKTFAVNEAIGETLSDSRPQVAEIAGTENIHLRQFSENQTVVR